MRQILIIEDDAFHTQLLAVARAVSWGMKVTQQRHRALGDRLAGAWKFERNYGTRDRMISLIRMAFSRPLPPIMEEWVGASAAVTSDAATLAAYASDDTVLTAVRRGLHSPFAFFVHAFTDRLDVVAKRAVEVVLEEVACCDGEESVLDAARTVLCRLAKGNNGKMAVEKAWIAGTIPESILLHVRAGLGHDIGDTLVEALRRGSEDRKWSMHELYDAFWQLPDAAVRWQGLVKDPGTDREVRHRLLWEAAEHVPEAAKAWLFDCAEPVNPLSLRTEALATLTAQGDEPAFDELTRLLPLLDVLRISMWCVALGVHNNQVAVAGLEHILTRDLSSDALRRIVASLSFPIHYRTKPWGLSGSASGEELREHVARPQAAMLADKVAKVSVPGEQTTLKDYVHAVSFGVLEWAEALGVEVRRRWEQVNRRSADDESALGFDLHEAVHSIPLETLDEDLLREGW